MSATSFKPLKEPIDAFFFDCDGTLSLIEGIDVLAQMNGVYEQVHAITDRCMSTTGLNREAYRERLDYVKPTLSQMQEISQLYQKHVSPGAKEIIQALRSLNKSIYILSAGIKSALIGFGQSLGIPPEHILAVDVYFDENGHYKGFNEGSFLVQAYGKPMQIQSIINTNQRALLIGDGISDWEAHEVVARFVGYAGLKAKESVKQQANFFINTPNFYSLLPLSLTQSEYMNLDVEFQSLYQLGLDQINKGLVLIKENADD